jgi:hypothetical protein
MSSAGDPSKSAIPPAAVPDQPPINHPAPAEPPPRGGRMAYLFWGVVTVAVIFAGSLFIFQGLLAGEQKEVDPDFKTHINLARFRHVSTGSTDTPNRLSYPLFHWATMLFTPLVPGDGWRGACQAAGVVLALALTLRGWLTYRELRGPLTAVGAALTCVLLAVAMALPTGLRSPSDEVRVSLNGWLVDFPSLWLGVVNPNVWHNPTTILAAPFAVLLFHQATLYLKSPGVQMAISVAVTAALCALAKPNYLLAFLPGFAVAMVAQGVVAIQAGRLRPRDLAINLVAAFALPAAVLAGQAWITFQGDTQLMVRPMAAWSIQVDPAPPDYLYWIRPDVLARRIPRAILCGIAFPCVVAACFPRGLGKEWRAQFAWLVLAIAVAEYALLAETGVQIVSGNFGWSIVPACYILFMESCRVAGRQPLSVRKVLCFGILTLHAAAGVICIVRAMGDPANALLY